MEIQNTTLIEMEIFSLPRSVIVNLLSVWIDASCLSSFDSAFCNSTWRISMLDIFEFEFFCLNTHLNSSSCLNYISNRFLKTNALTLNDNLVTSKNILNVNVSRVRSIKIVGCRCDKLPQQRLVSLINECVLLSRLELDDVQSSTDEVFLQFNPTILKHLSSIAINRCNNMHFTGQSVSHLATHCVNLIDISLGKGFESVPESDVVLFIQSNPQISQFAGNVLQDHITDKLLNTLAGCVELETLFLTSSRCWSPMIDPVRILRFLSEQCGSKLKAFHICVPCLIVRATGDMLRIQANGQTRTDLLDFTPLFEKFRNKWTIQLVHLHRLFQRDGAELQTVLRNNPTLTKLTISQCDSEIWLHLQKVYEMVPHLQTIEFKSTDIYRRHKTCSIKSWKKKKAKENGERLLVFAEHLFSSVQLIQMVDAIPNLKVVHAAVEQGSSIGPHTCDAKNYCWDKGIEFEYVIVKGQGIFVEW